jgi:hypothetical protein
MSMGMVTIRMPSGIGSDTDARVQSPFSAKDIIKDYVPSGYRWWNKDVRSWMVDEIYVQDLVAVLSRSGYTVSVLGPPIREARTQPSQRPVSSGNWADGAFATCVTRDQVESMRKALLRVHHPDKGGSAAIVEEINAAAEKRRKKVYS